MIDDGLTKELYIQSGVLVEDMAPNKGDIDFHHNLGTLSVVEYNSDIGKCIEWRQCDVSIESHDQEWAIVEDFNNHAPDSAKNSNKPAIQMKMDKLISLDIYKKSNNVRLAGDGTKITFHFQHGNVEFFLAFLKGILRSSIHQRTSTSYVVTNPKEVEVLEKSFAELNLFTDDRTRSTVLWNFMKRLHESPYETTMDTFSKVTNTLLYRPRSQSEEEMAELLHRSLTGEEVGDGSGRIPSDEYEVVSKGPPLPPRSLPERGPPLTREAFLSFVDESGSITRPDLIREIIFQGGIAQEDGLRREVWRYLLGYYPWESTKKELEELKMEKTKEYYRMKSQWQSMTPHQIDRFGAYKMRMSLIEKDVHRTDRNMDFFAGDNNPNLTILQDILMTYVMYNFDLGYVQGMSDLLSPLLVQIQDEVDTFWCFVGFMNRISRNFELDQEGMKEQLQRLYALLCTVEPELASSLDSDSRNMSFCFRWLLVWFKREFSYRDIYLIWEVLWTEFACKNYHLFICTAILEKEKETIMSNGFGFTEILKHINELANTMNAVEILRRAEGIYQQISNCTNIPNTVREIVGLEPLPDTSDGGATSENQLDNDRSSGESKANFDHDKGEISSFRYQEEADFDHSLSLHYL